jgi:hypothetical protein
MFPWSRRRGRVGGGHRSSYDCELSVGREQARFADFVGSFNGSAATSTALAPLGAAHARSSGTASSEKNE